MPGSVDAFETAVKATIGQQISVAGARTVAGRIVAAAGEPLAIDDGPLTHVWPTPAALAAIDPDLLPMPRSRRRTVVELSRRVAGGELVLDAGVDRDEVRARLLDVPGIGPWTAGYVLMRGLGDPDVFLPTDLGVQDRPRRRRSDRRTCRHAGGRGAPTPCTTCGLRRPAPPGDERIDHD